MSNGPVASNLTLLSLLPSLNPGTKVRFLGHVEKYSVQNGRVYLRHPPSCVTALVDVSHDEISGQDLETGAWIHVIGYIEYDQSAAKVQNATLEISKQAMNPHGSVRSAASPKVLIQGLLIWNAGAIDLQAYESAAESRLRLDEQMREILTKNEEH